MPLRYCIFLEKDVRSFSKVSPPPPEAPGFDLMGNAIAYCRALEPARWAVWDRVEGRCVWGAKP